MKSEIKNVALVLGGMALAGGLALFANENRPLSSGLGSFTKAPTEVTSYSPSAAQPIDFEKVAAAAVPSVVHIKTVTKFKQLSSQEQPRNPLGDMFGDDFFKKFFGENGQQFQSPDQKASGSGVIISADGYIVTNNHVVDGATEIVVTLNDRKDYKAKVVGTDANTDLALIKIDGTDLPVMAIGNSDDVKLGQWVLAIGYPLNLDVTVTQGIVSAKSRNIGINSKGSAPVEAFIQTDAAVNPGSSGGALINTNGELVAINSAIASPTGSFAGYAYAIPSNLMKKVVGDIMKYGSVQRGYLGISMAPENLEESKKKELGINDDLSAVWVMDVDPQGGAYEAGIRKGDAITKINDAPVNSDAQLAEMIARQKPGDNVKITVMRGKEEKTFTAVLKNKLGTFASVQRAAIESLGAEFSTLSKDDASKLGIGGGVVVSNIHDGVISNQTNMRPGFVITKVGDLAVNSVDELKDAVGKQGSNFQIEGFYPGSKEIYYYGINDFRK